MVCNRDRFINLRSIIHNVDFCVVGGGLSGMCAAVAAARHGLKVAIMHDRPMFGGNASSEIRMWVCGAQGENKRETGLIEEIMLENLHRNPYRSYAVWDSVLFEFVKNEKNIVSILNCSCNDAIVQYDEIQQITGWQTTTQTWHTVNAKYFADCSGDSILAPLTGAEYRVGREGRSEFGESIAPIEKDKKTMGLTCMISARQMEEKRSFIPPKWARKFTKDDLPYRIPDLNYDRENYWYMEIGGEQDSIHDTEEIRDDLIKTAYGIWDFIKNSGECSADDWELDFVGFLPGKRESRRYIGDYVMTQLDVENEGKFEDIIAYGGWSMDDHNPGGINTKEVPTVFHDAPSPYGIPYRCVYSKNIKNLFFAGRNISVTHSAMSSTRVMATCATIGQAVGSAAFLANKYSSTPRGIYENHINQLKQLLMNDDCYLPFNKMKMSEIMMSSSIESTGENETLLVDGIERKIGDVDHAWSGKIGDNITIKFDKLTKVNNIRMVFDSDLDRNTVGDETVLKSKATLCNIPKGQKAVNVPKTIIKDFKVEYFDNDGSLSELCEINGNYQRLINISADVDAIGLKITVNNTNGSKEAKIYSINIT